MNDDGLSTAGRLVRWDRIQMFLHLGANRRVLVVTDSHQGDLARSILRFTSAEYTEISPSDPKLADLPDRSVDVIFLDETSDAAPTFDRLLGSDGTIVVEGASSGGGDSPWGALPHGTTLHRTVHSRGTDEPTESTVALTVWSRTPNRLDTGRTDDYDLGRHAAETLIRDLTRLRAERDRFASALVDAEQALARLIDPEEPRYWRREAQTGRQRVAELANQAKARARKTAGRARARLRNR